MTCMQAMLGGFQNSYPVNLRSKVKTALFVRLSITELTDLVRLPDRSLSIELLRCACGAL